MKVYGGRTNPLLLRAITLLPLLLAIPASAQDIGDAAHGRQLADTWCSSCHIVGPTTARGTSNGAPTFAAVASMNATTPMSLRAFLATPHANMPDLHLTNAEIDDLSAYILSLRRKPAR